MSVEGVTKDNFIQYQYRSDGVKLGQKVYTNAEVITTRDYCGRFVYENQELSYIIFSEGTIRVSKINPGDPNNPEFIAPIMTRSGTQQYGLTREFHLKDHLGNVRVVFNTSGILSENHYYPFGLPIHNLSTSTAPAGKENRYLYNGKELQDDLGLNWMDYGARFYDAGLGRWHSVDPLAEAREWLSPYNYVQNNPLNRIDPTGTLDNPIYDLNSNFLGTDDRGLQGEAIIMRKEDFKQGMSHEDALSKGTLRSQLPMVYTNSFYEKIDNHHSNLPSRPDWDGYLTLDEANEWYRNGNGQPLFVDLSKIDLSGINSLGEKYVDQVKIFNLLINSGSLNDGLVYGKITLKRYPNHQVRAFADKYDFEMHNPRNPFNWGRNAETVLGRIAAGEGTPFEINIHGSATLKPLFPWIK